MSNPFIIGLTGGIGSGKSLVTQQFQALGIDIIDADIEARNAVKPGTHALQQIHARLGASVISDDGSLNRGALRAIIFDAPEEKQWLETLLHPIIHQRVQDKFETAQSPYCIYVSPLLLETQQQQRTHRVVVVDALPAQQQQRSAERDGVSPADIDKIIAAQMSREQRLQKANDVIDNTGSVENTIAQVNRLHETYLRLAHSHSP